GGFDPRKNMDGALTAFALLVQGDPQTFKDLRLYVVCACSPASRARYERLAERLGVKGRMVLAGQVGDEALPELYRGASAFFFPSRYEGFGLPVLEALACGLPVVTARVSSLPEAAGDVP